MAEVNETKKTVKNRKKTVWLIVAGAVLAVMLARGARALLSRRQPSPHARSGVCHAAARTGSNR